MPSTPYVVEGILYDSNGTSALSSVKVICKNVTNNETQNQTTDSSGAFLFDLSNFTSGYSTGDEISLFASYGDYYIEYIFNVVSGGGISHDLTLDTLIQSAALYCSVTDVRRFTGIDSSEFSDAAVYEMIQRVTGRIDEMTGRTWKGIQTETDEYYDGDDTDLLWLNQTDLVSTTAVSIDDNLDGTYTSITITKIHTYPEGYIVLDRNAEITTFVAGPQTIKVTYTYGNARPTEAVRELAILMVANLMHMDNSREALITRVFQKLRWFGPRGLA